jgi:Arc/MetJ-type ribon-helix-helix transcriptional regulator
MNPLINVRIPKVLQKEAKKHMVLDGYTNMQELIKSLLRDYAEKKKRGEDARKLLSLYGSQKGVKASKEELSDLAKKLYG